MLAPPYIARRIQSQKWMLPRVVYVLIAASISMYSLFFLRAEHAGAALLNFRPAWAAGSAEGDRAVQASWFEMGHLPEQEAPDDEHLAICVAVKEQQEDMMQIEFYRRCLKRWRNRHTWMAFIDADEFFYTPGPESLLDILRPLEANLTIGAFAVNVMANPHLQRPPNPPQISPQILHPMRRRPWRRPQGEINRHIKTIVKTKYGEGPRRDPHSFYLLNHTIVVGEDEQEAIAGPFRLSLTRNRVGLAHYALKSRAEFVEKSNRGTAQNNYKGDAFWDALEKYARHTNCTDLVHYDP
ncbi:hypothetical protein F5X68DRAFT_240666 [Plectosphaerella plurivora]|uniref:Glycosyltransferase family 92 protein n=1 Tax=Plectosphaerella plurivora TaxID=936078 RepID=A0A9P9A9U9_9PEZI|nr:hypothetical protein F5X68DRAFT_240666 [Plectosphaerella plurivora]